MATPDQRAPESVFPIRLGTAREFSQARELFRAYAFEAPAICRALNIAGMGFLDELNWETVRLERIPPALNWCIRVFVQGVPVSAQESEAICGRDTLAALCALGLLHPSRRNPEELVSPVWLYPVDGFVIASDRRSDPDGGAFTQADDAVFPACFGGSMHLVDVLPEAHGLDVVDLGGGTGIAAMHLARSARSAVSTDIAERATHFAKFNAALAGSPITVTCGDLYAPLQGRQFDLIASHPPYVPTAGQVVISRDGGVAGEKLTQRIVAGLPAHLRTGGTCIFTCLGYDAPEQTYEQRAREWLGDAGENFDIIFGLLWTRSLEQVIAGVALRDDADAAAQSDAVRERLDAFDIREFVYGVMLLRKCEHAVPQEPLRIAATVHARAADFYRLFDWRERARSSGFAERLGRGGPYLAPQVIVKRRYAVGAGGLGATSVLTHKGVFTESVQLDAAGSGLLEQFDGRRTLDEAIAAAQAGGDPAAISRTAALELVRSLAERGFLHVDLPE